MMLRRADWRPVQPGPVPPANDNWPKVQLEFSFDKNEQNKNAD